MPDIKTAFEKALAQTQAHIAQPIPAEWDDKTAETKIEEVRTMQTETKRVYFQTTNNVTRVTFEYVRDNPGNTRVSVVDVLKARGYNPSSVGSLLGQMVKQGQMRESKGLLYAVKKEYEPLKSSARRKQTPAEAQTKVAQPAPANTLSEEPFNAEKFVNGLTFKQAKDVYDYLRKTFGG